MSYPSSMHDSLAKVVATRERRMNEQFPRASAEEKQQVLKANHPDYRAETFAELRVGPNAGGRTPRE
ncbi:succinate dehydrogenase/fumarate reductase flavoprotein subunit, partial [candidate division WOR-3 bacterium]|nr:succinate dehydrogenase/fumarate reductase flavoprotein subunit [candidate division WOR-3 bacterium]